MTDDQTVQSLRVMSNVKRLLAERGTTFTRSFRLSAVLPLPRELPHRAVRPQPRRPRERPPAGGYAKLDRLEHPARLAAGRRLPHDSHRQVPERLRRANDPLEIPPGWSEWHGSVDPSTYHVQRLHAQRGRNAGYDVRPLPDRRLSAKAVDVIRRRAPLARPFFLWVAFLAPHQGGRPPRRPGRGHRRRRPRASPPGRVRLRAAAQTAELQRGGRLGQAAGHRGRAVSRRSVAAIRENYRLGLETLLAVDRAVTRIVAGLCRESGELGNTFVIFTSDNGCFHGEHRIARARTSLRPVHPCPAGRPGARRPGGTAADERVANIDLAPTIVDAADAQAGRIMDGRSLLPFSPTRADRLGATSWSSAARGKTRTPRSARATTSTSSTRAARGSSTTSTATHTSSEAATPTRPTRACDATSPNASTTCAPAAAPPAAPGPRGPRVARPSPSGTHFGLRCAHRRAWHPRR